MCAATVGKQWCNDLWKLEIIFQRQIQTQCEVVMPLLMFHISRVCSHAFCDLFFLGGRGNNNNSNNRQQQNAKLPKLLEMLVMVSERILASSPELDYMPPQHRTVWQLVLILQHLTSLVLSLSPPHEPGVAESNVATLSWTVRLMRVWCQYWMLLCRYTEADYLNGLFWFF